MSKLETNQVDPSTGTTLTLGTSGDTIAIPSGVTITNSGTANNFGGVNTPAFEAILDEATQTVSDDTYTKIQLDTETVDTNGCFNATANTVTLNGISVPSYSFAPNVSGKYFIYGQLVVNPSASNNVLRSIVRILKNGTSLSQTDFQTDANPVNQFVCNVGSIISFNGTSDYVHIEGYLDVSSGTPRFLGSSTEAKTFFGGYKIIE